MDNKTDLRLRAKSIRKTLDIGSLSNLLIRQMREFKPYKSAGNVMLFYPMKYEINLLGLLNDDKNFFLPSVCDEKLQVCPFKQSDRLLKSDFNVCEPCTNPVNPKNLDLVIVPALMVDRKNYRLGYGGGFYDRFLAEYPEIPTVVPIAKELFVENLPVDKYDIKIDYVLLI